MKERLQKVLAARGVASRRRAEELILAGAVTVNGRIASTGQAVDPESDRILVHGEQLPAPRMLYLALNKPVGFVSSLNSTHGERTVLELVQCPERVYPVGRLDRDTSGLLLLSNDGAWTNIVSHPRYGVEKEYIARVKGRVSEQALARLRRGVALPDGTITAPAKVALRSRERDMTGLSITVRQGKKRQIRHMADAVGHPILALRRVRIGPVLLGNLPEGRWRQLEPEEIEAVWSYGRTSVA